MVCLEVAEWIAIRGSKLYQCVVNDFHGGVWSGSDDGYMCVVVLHSGLCYFGSEVMHEKNENILCCKMEEYLNGCNVCMKRKKKIWVSEG